MIELLFAALFFLGGFIAGRESVAEEPPQPLVDSRTMITYNRISE